MAIFNSVNRRQYNVSASLMFDFHSLSPDYHVICKSMHRILSQPTKPKTTI